ncbi:hypothetical protein [Brevibacillus antibioticus]|uniref:hypothetical protein n=1 Tax=Brevibacillus antibioticus TaxID=2570228 RepID=UPI001390405B|nr:hypothetical protein [Brevibacillus antibioticus]
MILVKTYIKSHQVTVVSVSCPQVVRIGFGTRGVSALPTSKPYRTLGGMTF